MPGEKKFKTKELSPKEARRRARQVIFPDGDLVMEYNAAINGIIVNAKYSERAVRDIFLPLLEKLTEMQRSKRRRILVMLAAPPGAGKSTLLSFLEELSFRNSGLEEIQGIGMDGFHRRQEYLLNHYIERDGEQIPMVKIKGAPVTFDLEQLTARVKKTADGEVCGWPVYDRILHNPVDDAMLIDRIIVILEGNYLLLNQDGWRDLSGYADYTVSIKADPDFLRNRLIDRRIKTGTDREEAVRFVDNSDMPNVRLCLDHSIPADLELRLDEDGDYHIV